MPNDKKKTVMRAPTRTERVGDMLRGAYESVAEQPLVRIADMLGLSNIRGVANSFSDPNATKTAEMMGGPGNLAKLGMSRGMRPPTRYQGPMESPTSVAKSHPALPAEFNMEVRNPSRTAPIDMNNPPSGKMEFLDPDIAELMNPGPIDVTTKEGQRRLRLLTGK